MPSNEPRVQARRAGPGVRKLLTIRYDVTGLTEEQAGRLAFEAAVQAEASDDHPDVPPPEVEWDEVPDEDTVVELAVGSRVRLRQPVDRYPHFSCPPGLVGTVASLDSYTVCVHMDEHVSGAEPWDNEIVWSLQDGDDPLDDLEVLEPLVVG